MELFLFIIISFSFIALVAFGAHYSGVFRKNNHQASPPAPTQDRKAPWMLFLNPRLEPGIFVRNLRTNEQVFLPSPEKFKKDELSLAWIVALFSATVALGCLAGFILYRIWDFVLKSWF